MAESPSSSGERKPCPGHAFDHSAFVLKSQTFTQQFSHLYYMRLKEVKETFRALIEARWRGVPIVRIVNVTGDRCCVMGTIYKNMVNKPNFLKQYIREVEVGTLEEEVVGTSDDDHLSLEDESGRVDLTGNIPHHELCTGLIIAALGKVDERSRFVVEEWTFCGEAPQPALEPVLDGPAYVAFVSGIAVGEPRYNPLVMQAVQDFLRGEMGCLDVVRNITRLVVCGGVIHPTDDLLLRDKIKLERADHKKCQEACLVPPMKKADEWLSALAESLPVDVMPGSTDPTNSFIPHQPIHPCLLPAVASNGYSALVTDPFKFKVNGDIIFLGTSGDNVADVLRYTRGNNPLKVLRMCLEARIIAPTAPDTLACYPFTDVDPLIIKETPHVLFCGGHPFATELHRGKNGQVTRLISVPSFWDNPGIVLVDTASSTLETIHIPITIVES